MRAIRFPFGRHRGKPLNLVPTNYLNWVLAETEPEPWLRAAIRVELDSRDPYEPGEEYADEHECSPLGRVPNISRAVARSVIVEGRRNLAKRFHPDATNSGDSSFMGQINAASDWLLSLVEHLPAGVTQ